MSFYTVNVILLGDLNGDGTVDGILHSQYLADWDVI